LPTRNGDPGGIIRRDAKTGLTTTVSPLFLTYFMMNWAEVSQTPSSVKCLSCGGEMMSVEPVRDKKGVVFEGIVCHKCKTLLWSRKR
jgi:hypothetical protein